MIRLDPIVRVVGIHVVDLGQQLIEDPWICGARTQIGVVAGASSTGQAACWYSLITPPRTLRRLIGTSSRRGGSVSRSGGRWSRKPARGGVRISRPAIRPPPSPSRSVQVMPRRVDGPEREIEVSADEVGDAQSVRGVDRLDVESAGSEILIRSNVLLGLRSPGAAAACHCLTERLTLVAWPTRLLSAPTSTPSTPWTC